MYRIEGSSSVRSQNLMNSRVGHEVFESMPRTTQWTPNPPIGETPADGKAYETGPVPGYVQSLTYFVPGYSAPALNRLPHHCVHTRFGGSSYRSTTKLVSRPLTGVDKLFRCNGHHIYQVPGNRNALIDRRIPYSQEYIYTYILSSSSRSRWSSTFGSNA